MCGKPVPLHVGHLRSIGFAENVGIRTSSGPSREAIKALAERYYFAVMEYQVLSWIAASS
jgi:hypothetical protein